MYSPIQRPVQPNVNLYPEIWDPGDSEILVTANSDFLNTLGGWFITNKTIVLCEVPIRNVGLVTGALTRMRAPGANLQSNKCKVGLYTSTGSLLASTGPLGPAWQTPENPDGTGTKIKMPFIGAPISVIPGKHYVAYLMNYAPGSGSAPEFSRGAANSNCNIGYDLAPWRFSSLPPNQSNLPTQINLLTVSYSEEAVYAALYYEV